MAVNSVCVGAFLQCGCTEPWFRASFAVLLHGLDTLSRRVVHLGVFSWMMSGRKLLDARFMSRKPCFRSLQRAPLSSEPHRNSSALPQAWCN